MGKKQHMSREDLIKSCCSLKESVGAIKNMTTLNNALRRWKEFGAEKDRLDGLIKTKIAITGNCTLKPLADYLRVGMFLYDIDAEVFEFPYDQWANQMLDQNAELYHYNPSFLVLYLSSLGLTCSGSKMQFEVINILENCIDNIERNSSIRVVMILPELLEEEYYTSSKIYMWRNHFTFELFQRFESRLIFIDPNQVITDIGRRDWFSSRFWYHAKMPCHPNALISLGRHIAITVAHCISLPVKVVVCDLDNILWGGIVGEDGWQNLKLDVYSTGGPYIRLQALLKGLTEKGILLVAVSKNNEEDVREVFVKRDEMLLQWDDFTMVVANWLPKSGNIANIAKTLNLGLKYFCFIDDSPFERQEVRHALPEVNVPEMPVNPEEYISFLMESGLFHIPVLTDEDIKRTTFYRSEMARGKSREESTDYSSYLKSLGLKIYPFKIGNGNMDRVVQLINKTNQFNLTSRRYDYELVQKFAVDDNVFSYCYMVSDSFGDSGITGVLIAIPSDESDAYIIDTWLLSCRVMGRTVEKAMFEHLLSWSKSLGINTIIGEYIPTEKNKPVNNLFKELGFNKLAHDNNTIHAYRYDVIWPYTDNKYVTCVINE